MATEKVITIRSSFGPQETMKRYDAAVRAKGLTVFATIDHAAGATAVGLTLRPTALIIFGNAKGGTPLMQANQTSGIDLPLRRWSGRMTAGRPGCPTTIRPGSRHATRFGTDAAGTATAMQGLLATVANAATAP